MSFEDKYPSIFLPQMEAIVFIILQIFFATRVSLKIGKYLTIIPEAREGKTAHEAKPNGLLKSPPIIIRWSASVSILANSS